MPTWSRPDSAAPRGPGPGAGLEPTAGTGPDRAVAGRGSSGRRLVGFLGLVALLLLLGPGCRPAAAQRSASSAEARSAQFVFVVDDSGSMRKTDPNRLAVFAVRSILGMLDDRDEVSVVRLNAPRDGAPPPPVEPLRDNRAAMERLLDLDGAIARYAAQKTPCTSALESVRRLLDASWRPGAAQVVMFLTDGACDPADFHDPQAAAFLDGLRAHEEELFQFYLLRFRGNRVSPALAEVAEATGGAAIEVSAEDPTAILHPFARALSRSQGYEAYLLTPGQERLPAHRGAERVRLLAVAPGRGPDLALSIRDARGRAPEDVGPARTGVHRYGSGEVFRFAALDYRPGVAPVTVSVQGAGGGWKVVAVPEYRISVALRTLRGPCGRPGEAVEFGVDVGTTVCVVAELRNASGELVGGSLSGDLVARVQVRRPDRPGEEPVELVANQMGDRARFGVQQSTLGKGRYEFAPEVTLALTSGEEVTLKGRPVSLEVASIEIEPHPERFDLGTLRPGEGALETLRLAGSFPAEPGKVVLRDRGDIPACVHAALSGRPEGATQPIHADHDYKLALQVSAYCGPEPRKQTFDTVLQLVFEPGAAGRPLPTVEVPLTFTLDYRIEVPDALEVEVTGGDASSLPVEVEGNGRGPFHLTAVLAGPEEAETWPEDPEHLALDFTGAAAGGAGEGRDTALSTVAGFGETGAATPLALRARAHRCCAAGAYRTRMGFTAAPDQVRPPGAPPLEAAVISVDVQVAPAGFWACHGPWILWALLALMLLLLVLYVANMFRNSRFLDPRRLADRLTPLVWTGMGGATERRGARERVRAVVRRNLKWRDRIQAWLRANPLAFGLPGGAYDETVELHLRPHPEPTASQIRLVPRRAVIESVRAEPERHAGKLFASAKGGTSFVGVPDARGRIGLMVPDGGGGAPPPVDPGEPFKPQPIDLRRTELLRPLEPGDYPGEGDPAGWRIGG